jgi:hypothetical protein
MAFKFGAFVGGFSEQLVKDLEAEEERQFEMEKIATTEAMRQRAAASSRRRSEQLATEQLMGALSMFYGPEAAAEIAKRGPTAADFAIEAAQKATERGVDPNTLWRITTNTGDLSDPTEQAAMNETIDIAQAPDAPITAGVEGEGAPAPTITTGEFGINRDVFAQIYGEPTELANSYGAALARISQQLLRTTDENERARLEAERRAIIEDYTEFEAAGRAPQEEAPVFNYGTLPANVNEALRNSRNRYGFETDLEGNILNMTEGNEHRSYIAELSAAQTLDSTYGALNDPAMNNRIADIREQASRDLIEYGRRIVSEGDSRRLKNVGSQTAFAEGLISGQYRIGDVITYEDARGITRYAIYTGILNDAGIPVVMGR